MRKNMFYSALLLTLANLLLRTISMVFQVYLSNLVGAAGIGLLQLVLTVGAMGVTVGTSGVRVAGMYLCAEELGHHRPGGVRSAMTNCLRYALVCSTIAGAAMILFAPQLAGGWIGDLRGTKSLQLTGLFLPFTCLSAVMSGYFTAASKVGRLVAVDIAERVLSIFITVFLLRGVAAGDTELACCAIVAGNNIATAAGFFLLYALYLADRRAMGAPRRDVKIPGRMFRLCLPLAANEYLRSGLGTLEHMLIPRGLAKSGDSYENSMAAYGTIHGMVFPILFFPTSVLYSLSDLLVPELAKCSAAGRTERIRHLTDKCLRLGAVYTCAIAGGLWCLADGLGRQIYAASADAVALYLRLFAPLVLVLYLDTIVDGMNKGLGQQVICVRYNTFTSLLDVILIFFLLPKYGIGGYYFSFAVTHLINFFLSARRLLIVSGYRLPLRFLCKVLFCAVTACAAAAQFTAFAESAALAALLLQAGIYLGVFSALSSLLRLLSAQDLVWLKKVILPKSTVQTDSRRS